MRDELHTFAASEFWYPSPEMGISYINGEFVDDEKAHLEAVESLQRFC